MGTSLVIMMVSAGIVGWAAQSSKGRTGVLWAFCTFLFLMIPLYLLVYFGTYTPERYKDDSGWIALGVLVSLMIVALMAVVIATLPDRRRPDTDVKKEEAPSAQPPRLPPAPSPPKDASKAFEPQGVLNGIPYDIGSDGSITAMMPGGLVRFKTKDQFLAAASGSSTEQSGVMREPRNDEELIALINSVLGLPISDSVISELSGYKKQIESGIIQVDDRKYVVDLCKRLLSQKHTAAPGTSVPTDVKADEVATVSSTVLTVNRQDGDFVLRALWIAGVIGIVAIGAIWLFAKNLPPGDQATCQRMAGDESIVACTRQIESRDIAAQFRAVAYRNRGVAYAKKGDYESALADLNEAIRLDPKYPPAYNNRGVAYASKGDLERAIADYNEAIRLDPKYAFAYKNRGISNEKKGDLQTAQADYDLAVRLAPEMLDAVEGAKRVRQILAASGGTTSTNAAATAKQIQPPPVQPSPGSNVPLSAERERALKPKDSFRECASCPEMVVVPAGSFTMGSRATEKGRNDNEGPQHKITIARVFAVSRFEVTFDEWDACVANGACKQEVAHCSYCRNDVPGDQGWGRGTRPVINVSWDDAQQYVAWLSTRIGKPYRLLSEAEWEYAARAGSSTAYFWGDEIGKGNANCNGCGSQWGGKQTGPVGSFAANAFGLYDMAGNVSDWVEDCYNNSYAGAPSDASAWTSGDCSVRVVRGGSWVEDPPGLRSADRVSSPADGRLSFRGFRLGRTLTP